MLMARPKQALTPAAARSRARGGQAPDRSQFPAEPRITGSAAAQPSRERLGGDKTGGAFEHRHAIQTGPDPAGGRSLAVRTESPSLQSQPVRVRAAGHPEWPALLHLPLAVLEHEPRTATALVKHIQPVAPVGRTGGQQ